MKLKILAIGIILMMAGSTLLAVKCKSIETNKTEIFLNDKSELGVTFIEASSSYEYGLKVGKMLGLQYRIIDHFASSRQFKLTGEEIKEQIAILEKYCPSIIEEFKGLSASTNIKLEKLILLENYLESILRQGCTTTASTGNATISKKNFLTQQLDVAPGLQTFSLRFTFSKLHVKKINSGYSYVFLGPPIIGEKPLLNEKGLGLVGTTIYTNEEVKPADRGPGMPIGPWYQSVMMECKNITEVIPFYKGDLKPSTEKIFSNDVWGDAEGNIMDVEMTYHYLITVFGNSTDITGAPEGILWHANHHQWLDPNKTGSLLGASSKLRAERARQLLLENYGNINLEVLEEICSDHNGGFNPNKKDSGDICRHIDSHGLGFTLKSVIIQPSDLIIYYSNGAPCRRKYIEYDFSKIFEK